MSQRIYLGKSADSSRVVKVVLGYDRPLNYVFCVVYQGHGREETILYSNLDDPRAGISQQDVNYYRPILKELGISLPEVIFSAVRQDQLEQARGNIVVHYDELGEIP